MIKRIWIDENLIMHLLLMNKLLNAHPFDVELYGHRLEVVLNAFEPQKDLIVHYRMEVPIASLKKELDASLIEVDGFQDWSLEEQKIWVAVFYQKKYAEFSEQIVYEIDERREEWREIRFVPEQPQREGSMVVFSVRLSSELPEGWHQMSLINQNYMSENAVFSTSLKHSSGFVVHEFAPSDLVQQGLWTKKEEHREIRLVYLRHNSIQSHAEALWRKYIWRIEDNRSLEDALLEQSSSFIEQVERKRMSFLYGLMILLSPATAARASSPVAELVVVAEADPGGRLEIQHHLKPADLILPQRPTPNLAGTNTGQ